MDISGGIFIEQQYAPNTNGFAIDISGNGPGGMIRITQGGWNTVNNVATPTYSAGIELHHALHTGVDRDNQLNIFKKNTRWRKGGNSNR